MNSQGGYGQGQAYAPIGYADDGNNEPKSYIPSDLQNMPWDNLLCDPINAEELGNYDYSNSGFEDAPSPLFGQMPSNQRPLFGSSFGESSSTFEASSSTGSQGMAMSYEEPGTSCSNPPKRQRKPREQINEEMRERRAKQNESWEVIKKYLPVVQQRNKELREKLNMEHNRQAKYKEILAVLNPQD